MSDENKEVIEFDLSTMKAEVKAELKAEMEAEQAAKLAKQAEIDKAVEEAIKATEEKLTADFDAKKAAWENRPPTHMKRVGKYDKKNAWKDEFTNWVFNGDMGGNAVLKAAEGEKLRRGETAIELALPTKYEIKALQEGADTEGGVLVPDDFEGRIVALREQFSWVRNVPGLDIRQTSRDMVKVPYEATALTALTATAEEGAYTTNDPLFDDIEISIYKFTKLTKVSEELEADEDAGFADWFARRLAQVAASTESRYVAVGTGSSQPQGVFVGGTAGQTADTTTLAAADVVNLLGKLKPQYQQGAAWLMHHEVLNAARALRDANDWVFPYNPGVVGGTPLVERFYAGLPVFTDEACATMAASAKTVLVGNFAYYAFRERKALTIMRNPYLYMANGQIGLFANFRFGGAVTQAEAFQYLTMNT